MSLPGIGGGDQGGAGAAGGAGGASPADALQQLDPVKKMMKAAQKDGGQSQGQQVGNAAAAGPG